MVDVSEPLRPKFAGCYGDDGYTHDAECLIYQGPDTEHRGKEICFCYNGRNGLTVVDVTERSNPVWISSTLYPGLKYTHQVRTRVQKLESSFPFNLYFTYSLCTIQIFTKNYQS